MPECEHGVTSSEGSSSFSNIGCIVLCLCWKWDTLHTGKKTVRLPDGLTQAEDSASKPPTLQTISMGHRVCVIPNSSDSSEQEGKKVLKLEENY